MSLEMITSDLLRPIRHGFFTRAGGASSGIFQGLNCGPGSSDMAEAVAMNRARVTAAMDLAPGHLVTLQQVHSARVVVLDGPPEAPIAADAMVTRQPGLGLGVLTADCQPVLLADPEAGVIGAAHAGWKGAQGGILQAVVGAMVGLGASAGRIRAAIGPTISQRAYEVGPEFVQRFLTEDPDSARYFAAASAPAAAAGHAMFDLPAYGLAQLRTAGVAEAEWTRHCTYHDAQRFYSYRRATHAGEADYGRLIAVIRL